MTIKEYMHNLLTMNVDVKKVEKLHRLFDTTFPEVINRIISNNDESIFFDDEYRILSFQEIIDAENDLHIDFKAKGIIPIVDCGENDFIVYHFNDDIWSKFNIVDETVFKIRNSFDEIID